MEGFKNKAEVQETSVDWNALIRGSFVLSQGLFMLQAPITRWLALGYLHDQFIDASATQAVRKSMVNYSNAIMEKGRNHTTTTANGKALSSNSSEVGKVLENFHYEVDSAFQLSDNERREQKRALLGRIADGLVNRDKTFLLEREGRPVGEGSRRDKWSSFIIDFGILKNGDALFTWNSLADPFKELWDEVLPVIVSRYPEEMRLIAAKYIKEHPELHEGEIQQIHSILNSGKEKSSNSVPHRQLI